MKRKTLLNLMIMFLLIIFLVPFASGEFWACFINGELMDYCDYRPFNGTYHKADETCDLAMGCKRCMYLYDSELKCYVHGGWPTCMQLPPDECQTSGNVTFDLDPPELTINSPQQDEVYNSRSVLLDFVLDENADVYYYDNINGRGTWTRVCSDCHKYSNTRSFDEGLNDLTFRAADPVGNTAYVNRSFYLDSQKPKIHNTKPEDGEYTNGEFSVEYTEENVKNITLYYQKEGESLQTIAKTDCPKGDKQICNFDDLLGELEGEFTLEYYFGVSDSAQTILSGEKTVYVDTIEPEMDVLSPHNPKLVYGDRKVLLDIDVNELVLLEYIDHSGTRPKLTKLCSNCNEYDKTKSFGDGEHNVDFIATDNAGNNVTVNREFVVDSKAPKISKTEPKNGFADGNFDVEFSEDNPDLLYLNYGNFLTGHRSQELDIENDCYIDRSKYYCSIHVDLGDYDSEKIEYWFNLTDIAGTADESKHIELDVDTTPPFIESLDYTVDGRYVYFDISIIEENFDEVIYIDMSDLNQRPKRLCSKLKDGKCTVRKSFREGDYDLSIQVTDEAGHAVSEPISFEIDY